MATMLSTEDTLRFCNDHLQRCNLSLDDKNKKLEKEATRLKKDNKRLIDEAEAGQKQIKRLRVERAQWKAKVRHCRCAMRKGYFR